MLKIKKFQSVDDAEKSLLSGQQYILESNDSLPTTEQPIQSKTNFFTEIKNVFTKDNTILVVDDLEFLPYIGKKEEKLLYDNNITTRSLLLDNIEKSIKITGLQLTDIQLKNLITSIKRSIKKIT